jgi:tetratricopeptide (TPR) repeat protein
MSVISRLGGSAVYCTCNSKRVKCISGAAARPAGCLLCVPTAWRNLRERVRPQPGWAPGGPPARTAAGRPDDALARHTEALRLAGDVGARDQQARAYTGLGHARAVLGDHAGARSHYERALASYAELAMPAAGEVRDRLAALHHPRRTRPTASRSVTRS